MLYLIKDKNGGYFYANTEKAREYQNSGFPVLDADTQEIITDITDDVIETVQAIKTSEVKVDANK